MRQSCLRVSIERRWLMLCSVATFAVPTAVFAQADRRVVRIGFLANQNESTASAFVEAFQKGLREFGWIEGQNIETEYRWANGNLDQHPALALDLVKLPVDLIVTGGTQAIQAARQASSTIPVVGAIMTDPVGSGFASSLGHPGGNVTGLADLFGELAAKQLQLFKEVLPKATRIAMLFNPGQALALQPAAEAAARSLGLDARVFQVREVADLEVAFSTAKLHHVDGVQVLPSPFFNRHRARIGELSAKHSLPSFSVGRNYVLDGGLMSYGPNYAVMFHRAAYYVDRILKGAKPADLPIEQPTKFELVINTKTARALGIKVPPSVLLRADEVIE